MIRSWHLGLVCLGSVGVGALVGWGVHGARKGELVKIYALEDPD